MNLFPDKFISKTLKKTMPPLNLAKIKQCQYAITKKSKDAHRKIGITLQ